MKNKIAWIISTAFVLLAGIFLIQGRGEGKESIAYEEVIVSLSDIEVKILSTGVVKPENRLEIKPPVVGRVEKVLVREGAKVRKGQVLAWMSSTERATMLDAASARGAEEVAKWEELYRPTPVLAPINGTVIQRNVESGQTFAATDAVFVMSDRLTVKAQVDETDLAQIQLGQSAEISLDAYSGKAILAKVRHIAYDATTVNNVTTYTVDILPDRTPDFMRSGMTANVTFTTSSKTRVLAIPASAVKTEKNRTYVLVPGDEESKKREVKTGTSDGKKTEILSGLTAGETVLVPTLNLSKVEQVKSSPFGMGPPPRSNKGGR